MAVRTGATAQLQVLSGASYVTVAKVKDISLNFNRDALETTGIGESDRTYAYCCTTPVIWAPVKS
jgi:hypothetical protein